MISQQTAYDIWIAYDEIAKGERLLAELAKHRQDGEQMSLRDSFGRQRSLQLGVPQGDNGHRLYDVQPALAVEVIKAHIATKQAALGLLNEQAKTEIISLPHTPLNP
jgi:hypothetical protein